MIKIIPPDAYDFGEPPVRLVKWARDGLGFHDRRALVKQAGEGFAAKLAKLERLPGDEVALNIALSTTEAVGPNRNGDGFRAEWCRRNHDTFRKHAKAFRDHNNRSTSPYYGRVKLSHFNEDMQRIELGIVYNATREAAERNGGLVADLEMEKLASGDVFPSSMACLVKKDQCSGCLHEARSRAEYCRGPLCKYGGLYDNIGKTFADGHHLHADNPDPDWFDISHIVGGRGADRTSFTLGLVKKAAEKVACGAQLADEMGLAVPFLPDLFGPAVARHAKVACDLTGRDARDLAIAPAFAAGFDLPPPPGGLAKAAEAFRALADARVVLPVRAFLELAGATPKEAAAAAPDVAALVPAAYAAILADGDSALASNPFVPAASAGIAHRKWASELAASASLEPAAVARRLALAAVRGATPKAASARPAPAVAPAARAYALYKIAALAALPEADRGRLLAAARAQDVASS